MVEFELVKLGWSSLNRGIISCPNCKRGSSYAVSVVTAWNPTTLRLSCECEQIIHIIDHQSIERIPNDKVTCWNCVTKNYCKMHTKDATDFYHRLKFDKLVGLMQDIAKKCPVFTQVED